jgi:hypothetical protein
MERTINGVESLEKYNYRSVQKIRSAQAETIDLCLLGLGFTQNFDHSRTIAAARICSWKTLISTPDSLLPPLRGWIHCSERAKAAFPSYPPPPLGLQVGGHGSAIWLSPEPFKCSGILARLSVISSR